MEQSKHKSANIEKRCKYKIIKVRTFIATLQTYRCGP